MSANNKRGLVISRPLKIWKGGVTTGGGLDPQEIRFSLLFWDELDFPSNSLVFLSHGAEAEYLIREGALKRTNVNVGGGEMGDILRRSHVSAFEKLDQAEPGVWSVATGENSISFVDEELEQGRGALVELHRAIPVPHYDVPLQDVLEFRQKRRDELLALRAHLEGVYLRISSAGDGELAWNAEMDALQKSIADHIKTSRESGLQLRWTSFEAGLNVAGGALATAAALTQGLPLLGALGIGAIAALSVKGGAALRQREPSATPFRYISRFHAEVFPSG